jgi:hypothetical protein
MIVIIILILVFLFNMHAIRPVVVSCVSGGHSAHTIVIDTLNITHALGDEFPLTIENCITYVLKTFKYDNYYFVLKKTNIITNENNDTLLDLAKKYKVFICYIDIDTVSLSHLNKSIDDLLCMHLAYKFRSKIITNDKLRDQKEFKELNNFSYLIYSWFKSPTKEFVNPKEVIKNYDKLKIKPWTNPL